MTKKIAQISLEQIDAAETATLRILIGGMDSEWDWTFAGPGHPKTLELNQRLFREGQQRDRAAMRNRGGIVEESLEEARRRNITPIAARVIGWSDVEVGGKPLPFSEAAALDILLDPKKVEILRQVQDFLTAEDSFRQRSAKA